jgi:hypothetical protein
LDELLLKVSGGKLHRDSMLLGISEDEGKHWVFVDLSTTQEQLDEMFPELAGKIRYRRRSHRNSRKMKGPNGPFGVG